MTEAQAVREREPAPAGEVLLRVDNLVKHYPLTRGVVFKKKVGAVQAVDGVSFELHKGETLGLVGESGCGKSTLSRTLLRLEEPTSGAAYFEDRNIFELKKDALRRMRRDIQIIFQDPYASLNPRMTVGDIVGEPFEIHKGVAGQTGTRQKVRELLDRVGLNPDYENRYPHQFSGGQRQRIGVARALALNPKVIICDEPVSALDVSVQAQVINLLEDIQNEFDLSYIFIAHDLSVVRHIADRVAVMYLGRIVELGDEAQIYDHALHPYTQALLSAVPIPDPASRERGDRIFLEGDVPSPANPPTGCRFRTRCWRVQDVCAEEDPALIDRFDQGHPAACHFAGEHQPGETPERRQLSTEPIDLEALRRPTPATVAAAVTLWILFGLNVLSLVLAYVTVATGDRPTGWGWLLPGIATLVTLLVGYIAARVSLADRDAAASGRNYLIVLAVLALLQLGSVGLVLSAIRIVLLGVGAWLCHRASES